MENVIGGGRRTRAVIKLVLFVVGVIIIVLYYLFVTMPMNILEKLKKQKR
jgi:uncharacterized membrane protein (Fun14 family)